MENAREIIKKKAQALRWQKPMAKGLNWWEISESLSDIMSACEDIRWMTEDDEQLIDLLDGDEEEAFEFKMAFSSLAADCDRMCEDMEQIRLYDFMSTDADDDDQATLFDLFFPAVRTSGPYLGYDEYEEDYLPIDGWQNEYASDVARKRLKRMTKEQLLDNAGMCLNVARSYLSIQYRYSTLKSAIDILKGINDGLLQTVKEIEEAWSRYDEDSHGGRFSFTQSEYKLDKMLESVPDRLWIE